MPFNLALLDSILDLAIKQMVGLQNVLPETTDRQLLELGHKYWLTIVTDVTKSAGEVTFDAINNSQKAMFAELLSPELGIYHPGVIQACLLQRLILCNDLKYGTDRLHGLSEFGRFKIDTLVLNAECIARKPDEVRDTLHHELFHAIDYRDDYQHYADTDWRKLNGTNYKYNESLQFTSGAKRSGCAYIPHFNFKHVEGVPRGFLNRYATQSVREDKAVVYAWLMIRYSEVRKIAQKDPIIASKVAYMKDLLSKFHPSFNDEFWQRVEKRSKKPQG